MVQLASRKSLRWRHNDHAGVSNHQPHGCLLNRLFRRKSKKTSKLRVTGLCAGNSPGTGEFPAQMASYAENVSIWWRHHVICFQWPAQRHIRAFFWHQFYRLPLLFCIWLTTAILWESYYEMPCVLNCLTSLLHIPNLTFTTRLLRCRWFNFIFTY